MRAPLTSVLWCLPVLTFIVSSDGAFAQLKLPPPADMQAPSGAPSAPGTPFALSLTGATSREAPVIAAWNESARPDESITLTGVRFTLQSGAAAGSDTHVWVSNGLAPVEAAVVKAHSLTLTVTLPAAMDYGMYLLWVANSAGPSLPVALNRAAPQWIGPLGNVAQPGSLKRIFGKDLSQAHGVATSYIYLRPNAGGAFVAARVTAVEPYAVTFEVPAELGYGSYSVFVHNGHGGVYGWGAPLLLQLAPRWTRGTAVIAVAPSAGQDDTAALQAAMNSQSAQPFGGSVQLSEGAYRITRELSLPKNVRLLGGGKDRTVIEVHLATADEAALCVNGNHAEIRGITLKLVSDGTSVAPKRSILRGGQFPHTWEDITISDIRLTANGRAEAGWGRPNGLLARRIEISGSEFFRELNLAQSDYWVHDNVFHGGTFMGPGAGSEGAINLQGLQRLVLERNHFETPVVADWTRPAAVGLNIARRVLYAELHVSSIANLYIAHNTSKNVLTENDGNKGEMLLFHGAGSPWYGQAISTSGNTITVRTDGLIDGRALAIQNYGAKAWSGPLSDPLTQASGSRQPVVVPESNAFGQVGMFVSIVNGTGMGQIRQVTAITGNSITVSAGWRLPPDSTSALVLSYVYKDIVIYRNDLDAFPAGVWGRSSASALLQFGGNCWFNVADGNTSHRTFSGARIAASPLTQSWWNEIRDNQFLELRHVGIEVTLWENHPEIALIGPATLGNVFRGNRVQITGPQQPVKQPDWVYQLGSMGGNWTGGPVKAPFPYHVGNIFEHNKASGGRIGILAGDWAETLYRKNNLTVDRQTSERSPAIVTPAPIVTRPQSLPIAIGNIYSVQP